MLSWYTIGKGTYPIIPTSVYYPGGYSEFQVTGMIEWGQKSKPKKIINAFSKTQKLSLDQH